MTNDCDVQRHKNNPASRLRDSSLGEGGFASTSADNRKEKKIRRKAVKLNSSCGGRR